MAISPRILVVKVDSYESVRDWSSTSERQNRIKFEQSVKSQRKEVEGEDVSRGTV